MRHAVSMTIILVTALCLNGCTTIHEISGKTKQAMSNTNVTKTTTAHYLPTNPEGVLLTHSTSLKTHYKIIGKVAINEYNFVGIKRQLGVISDLMQQRAAEIGGNAVINIHESNNNQVGYIIKFVT